ncbi:MAG: hypothetical protein K2W93_07210 [Burkholderiaceae bacterium]|nr:hypothetical protein [Burkholderiaceae bacterium]
MAAAFNGVKSRDSWVTQSPLCDEWQDAINWLANNQDWLADAATYVLMSFEEFSLAEIDASKQPLPAAIWQEPRADWVSAARQAFQTKPYAVTGWEEKFRHLAEPMNDWLTINCLDDFDCPMPRGQDECAELLALQSTRTLAQEAEITLQAASIMDALWPVQKVLGDPHASTTGQPLKSKTIELIAELLDAVQWPLFILKRIYNRGRPDSCCGAELKPMFADSPLQPKHPSFPSAHACNAYVVALLLNQISPKPGSGSGLSAYEEAALKVAKNREIAGLHYASDSAAGIALAKHLLAQLNASPHQDFTRLLAAAKAEWP